MPRWSKVSLAILALVVVAGAVAWVKLPEIVVNRVSAATGRKVSIGALHLSPGRWLGVDLRDASLANLPGGSRPEMATVARITGEVALWPLLHGTVLARSVRVEKADILLEKVGQQPNWRNGPKTPERPDGGRTNFPTLLGAELEGVVTFRTTAGHLLVTQLDRVRLEADSADASARIVGPAAYQGVPIALDVTLGSYDQLHHAATPFPADIQLTSGDTVLHFVGTMTRPLDVDGALGRLTVLAPTPGVLEKASGIDPSPAPPLRLEGDFQHERDLWKLERAQGALGDAALETGTLQLQEGSREAKVPDRVDMTLRFATIDADRLSAAFRGPGSGGPSGFVPSAAPNPEVAATLEASVLTYDKFKLLQPKLSMTIAPRELTLDAASFGALGGQVQLAGKVRAEEDGKTGAVSATLTATGLDVSQLGQALGAGSLPLAGRADIHAVAAGTGPNASAALERGRASVIATMRGGNVSAQLVELASTDITGLLRSSRARVPIECLLAVLEVRGGVATIAPMRLRSGQGTIVARGQADLLRQTLNVVVASEASTTGLLALDVPVRVTGRFDDPSIAPAGAAAGRAARSISAVAAPLLADAQRSGCLR